MVPPRLAKPLPRVVRFVLEYGFVIGASLVVGFIAFRTVPTFYSVAFIVLMLVLALFVTKPLLALHAVLFLTLLGDGTTTLWYPVTKNMSSEESILYTHDALTITPLEVMLFGGFALWLLWHISTRRNPLVRGQFFWHLMVFSVFVLLGLMWGVGRGGDIRVAIWEVRPFLYLPIVYLLVINCCRTRKQFRQLLWTAVASLFAHSLFSIGYWIALPEIDKITAEGLGEHSSAIHMNVVILLAVMAALFKGCSRTSAIVLTLLAIPVAYEWILNQRRASVIALALGFLMLAAMLYWRQRSTFKRVVPVAAVLMIGYIGAMWNSTSSAAFPAQAVKAVIAQDQAGEADQSSDLYRIIENYDLNYTIRSEPIFGVGFGQQFYRPITLPDISFFEFYLYIPHNSILWVWLKTGFGGFLTFFYLLAQALMAGARNVRAAPKGVDMMISAVTVMYVAMFALFAFVDIAFDARSTLFLATCIAFCSQYLRVPNQPAKVRPDVTETADRQANALLEQPA
jgi:hypothetical protein